MFSFFKPCICKRKKVKKSDEAITIDFLKEYGNTEDLPSLIIEAEISDIPILKPPTPAFIRRAMSTPSNFKF